MIRKTTISLDFANSGKLQKLSRILEEYKRVVNLYVEGLWDLPYVRTFPDTKVDTWLSARMQQAAAKQASAMVRSTKKKHGKRPLFTGDVVDLDERFVSVEFNKNSFDVWIKFGSIGEKTQLHLPSRKTKHLHRFDGWKMRKGMKIKRIEGKFYGDLYFEKEVPFKGAGKSIGLDSGYRKLGVTSENQVIGQEFPVIVAKIARKKQGSKAFKRALRERDEYINREIKRVDLTGIKTVYVEDLKNVFKNTKIGRKTMNKLQRWTYSRFLNRLEMSAQVVGVQCVRVNPAYTSQTCPECGVVDKKSRSGEVFRCTSCGYEADADLVGALNILMRGQLREPIVPAGNPMVDECPLKW
jgi:IS605 OrfB family transposase